MQDATTIANIKGPGDAIPLTTTYLQTQPVDIHIMPKCARAACTATGDYINDDGLTPLTSSKFQRKEFTFSYFHTINALGTAPEKIVI